MSLRIRIGQAWEKRDWGGEKPTWRRVPALMRRYPRGTRGPSKYAVRVLTRKAEKHVDGYPFAPRKT